MLLFPHSVKVAHCFLTMIMALDKNEEKLIEKLASAADLLNVSKEDRQMIRSAKKIDDEFMHQTSKIFNNTEACNVCRNAFYSWRKTLDDETVLSFIDDWINWKKQNPHTDSKPVSPGSN